MIDRDRRAVLRHLDVIATSTRDAAELLRSAAEGAGSVDQVAWLDGVRYPLPAGLS